MRPTDRADLYAKAFAQFPASHLTVDTRWLQGTWILGNNYVGSGYYGSYPPGYVKRVLAMFPDAQRVLHPFSGSLRFSRTNVHHVTLDCTVTEAVRPSLCANALALPFLDATFDLGMADPPYSVADASRYGTPMVNRRLVLYELHRVIKPGGHLVWLDTVLPMFNKRMWHWYGAVTLIRSTNHRVRLASFFERVPPV